MGGGEDEEKKVQHPGASLFADPNSNLNRYRLQLGALLLTWRAIFLVRAHIDL